MTHQTEPNKPEEEWENTLDAIISVHLENVINAKIIDADNRREIERHMYDNVRMFFRSCLRQDRARLKKETESKLREIYNFVVLTSGKNGRKDILKYIDQALRELKNEKGEK